MKTQSKITGDFNWNVPKVLTSFIDGKDAQAIYNSLKGNIGANMSYDTETKKLIGSQTFAAARIDTILRPHGLRVANLADLSRPEVIAMTKGRFYADTPSIVARSEKDSNERNLPLLKRIIEEVEKKYGNAKFPFMITGFDVALWSEDKKGYGVNIVPRDDFTAIFDERLNGKYAGKTFSNADEIGLPLFDSKGTRTWYARNEGLSRLCLYDNSNFYSIDVSLAGSNSDGRVVVLSAEGASSKKYLDDFVAKSQTQLQGEIARARKECALKEQKLNEAYNKIMRN